MIEQGGGTCKKCVGKDTLCQKKMEIYVCDRRRMIWESIIGAYYEQRRLKCTKINLYSSSVLVGGCYQIGGCSVAFPMESFLYSISDNRQANNR